MAKARDVARGVLGEDAAGELYLATDTVTSSIWLYHGALLENSGTS